MSSQRSSGPYDFTHLPEGHSAPELSIETVRALLLDRAVSVSGGSATVRVNAALTSTIDLARYVRIATPLDELTVSVSHPVVTDAGKFVAGILFRRAHEVVPSGLGDGAATFGVQHYQDNFVTTDPPLAGARAELQFSPPRANKRYLLEFGCFGDSVRCKGSDGTSQQSAGPFAVVLFSSASSVTFTLDSTAYWWFRRCKVRWLPD
jgi:hypothetical protein